MKKTLFICLSVFSIFMFVACSHPNGTKDTNKGTNPTDNPAPKKYVVKKITTTQPQYDYETVAIYTNNAKGQRIKSVSTTTSNGNTTESITEYEYTSFGEISKSTSSTNGKIEIVYSYEYDSNNYLIKLTTTQPQYDYETVTIYTNNAKGQIVKSVSTRSSNGNTTESITEYEYTSFGEISKSTSSTNGTIDIVYNYEYEEI